MEKTATTFEKMLPVIGVFLALAIALGTAAITTLATAPELSHSLMLTGFAVAFMIIAMGFAIRARPSTSSSGRHYTASSVLSYASLSDARAAGWHFGKECGRFANDVIPMCAHQANQPLPPYAAPSQSASSQSAQPGQNLAPPAVEFDFVGLAPNGDFSPGDNERLFGRLLYRRQTSISL